MFAPTKTWRRWHRKVNLKEKRFAVCSALAASAVPSLVMARGHRVEKLNEIPLVVSNAAESIKKTKDAMALLEAVGASADVARVRSLPPPSHPPRTCTPLSHLRHVCDQQQPGHDDWLYPAHYELMR